MKVTAQEEYGLRCLLQVARLTAKDELASLADIAEAEKLTVDYAAKLLMILRQKKLIESVRGKSGGYRLAKPAASIYLDEVIRSLNSETLEIHSCEQFSGNNDKCIHINCCSMRSVWASMSQMMFNLLKQITLKDLLEGKENIATKIININKKSLVVSTQ